MKSGFSWIFAHLFHIQTRCEQNTRHFRAYGLVIIHIMFLCQALMEIIFLYANSPFCKTMFPC